MDHNISSIQNKKNNEKEFLLNKINDEKEKEIISMKSKDGNSQNYKKFCLGGNKNDIESSEEKNESSEEIKEQSESSETKNDDDIQLEKKEINKDLLGNIQEVNKSSRYENRKDYSHYKTLINFGNKIKINLPTWEKISLIVTNSNNPKKYSEEDSQNNSSNIKDDISDEDKERKENVSDEEFACENNSDEDFELDSNFLFLKIKIFFINYNIQYN